MVKITRQRATRIVNALKRDLENTFKPKANWEEDMEPDDITRGNMTRLFEDYGGSEFNIYETLVTYARIYGEEVVSRFIPVLVGRETSRDEKEKVYKEIVVKLDYHKSQNNVLEIISRISPGWFVGRDTNKILHHYYSYIRLWDIPKGVQNTLIQYLSNVLVEEKVGVIMPPTTDWVEIFEKERKERNQTILPFMSNLWTYSTISHRNERVEVSSTNPSVIAGMIRCGAKLECPVCMENITPETFATTPCGHFFHKGCLERWCENHSTCPSCRQGI